MIPESHPLQQLFQELVGRHYAEEIGIRDPQVVAYVSSLLAEFCDAEQLYKIRDAFDRPLADVGEMLLESDPVYGPAPSFDRERQVRKRYGARPGLICLWWIRKRANIAYAAEADVDAEYVESHSLRGDFGIALRAIPALLYGEGVAVTPRTTQPMLPPQTNAASVAATAPYIQLRGRCTSRSSSSRFGTGSSATWS